MEWFRTQWRNLWLLGIIAGGDSPYWLTESIDADYFEITGVDNTVKRIPKIWDTRVNERLGFLAEALSNEYNEDEWKASPHQVKILLEN